MISFHLPPSAANAAVSADAPASLVPVPITVFVRSMMLGPPVAALRGIRRHP